MKEGLHELTNKEYHSSAGISKSGLDLVNESPSSYIWRKEAPVNEDKLRVLDFGSHFHSFFLEPEEFKKNFQVMPSFNRRKPAEKQAELDLIQAMKLDGIIPVTNDDYIKLNQMRYSALAHPTVKEIMRHGNGVSEQSIYWNDEETGELCKCRPDYMLQRSDCVQIPDLKTTADISSIEKSIANFRYHVQDAFYTDGISKYFEGEIDFMFIFVSTTINCGRYPVRVVRLTDCAKYEGRQEYRKNLNTYHSHKESGSWETVETVDLPHWAYKEPEIYS